MVPLEPDVSALPVLSAPLRITMFVYGDVTHDARVLREAGSLAAAGHRVTIVARPADSAASAGSRWSTNGFDVVTVPVPGGWRRPLPVLGCPIRVAARALDRARPGHP